MHIVQGELKGVCCETFGEALVYRRCELDHRNIPLLQDCPVLNCWWDKNQDVKGRKTACKDEAGCRRSG